MVNPPRIYFSVLSRVLYKSVHNLKYVRVARETYISLSFLILQSNHKWLRGVGGRVCWPGPGPLRDHVPDLKIATSCGIRFPLKMQSRVAGQSEFPRCQVKIGTPENGHPGCPFSRK